MSAIHGAARNVERDEPIFGDLLRVWWAAKWVIAGAGAFGFLVAAGVSLMMKPVYRGTVTVAAVEQVEGGTLASLASQFTGLSGLSGFNLSASPDIDQSLAVLQSVQFTQGFVVEENAFAQLFADEWDPVRKALKEGSKGGVAAWVSAMRRPSATANAGSGIGPYEPALLWEAFRRFDQRRHIERDRKTQLVMISVDADDPLTAARWANRMVDALNAELRERAVAESEARTAYLEKRIATNPNVELRDSLYRLIEVEQKNALVANTRSDYALRVLSAAVPPDMRISPHRSLIALSGGLAGGLVAVLWCGVVGLARRLGSPEGSARNHSRSESL